MQKIIAFLPVLALALLIPQGLGDALAQETEEEQEEDRKSQRINHLKTKIMELQDRMVWLQDRADATRERGNEEHAQQIESRVLLLDTIRHEKMAILEELMGDIQMRPMEQIEEPEVRGESGFTTFKIRGWMLGCDLNVDRASTKGIIYQDTNIFRLAPNFPGSISTGLWPNCTTQNFDRGFYVGMVEIPDDRGCEGVVPSHTSNASFEEKCPGVTFSEGDLWYVKVSGLYDNGHDFDTSWLVLLT